MTTTRSLLNLLAGVALASGSVLLAGVPVVANAGPPPGMPDPSQMSGIPRADPNIAAGTVTVRCLIGSFANPALGIDVELSIETAGSEPVTLEGKTVAQGRATFSGLDQYFGSKVVASATIGGQVLRSQEFVLGPQSGVAVMLVATGNGAGSGSGAGAHGQAPEQAGDPHGGQGAMPYPGKPFPLEGRPVGTLIVGALDLGRGDADPADPTGAAAGEGIGPIPNVDVKLIATAPGVVDPIEII